MGENNKTKGPGQQESLLEVDSTSPDLGHGVADKKVNTSKITDFVKQQNEKHIFELYFTNSRLRKDFWVAHYGPNEGGR